MKVMFGVVVVHVGFALLAALTARAQPGSLSATTILNGAANVPPSNTPSTGAFNVILTQTLATFTFSVSNIANLTQVHLHQGNAQTADGPKVLIVIPTVPFTLTITGTLATSGNFTATGLLGGLAGKQLIDLSNLISAGQIYINAHTGSGDGTTYIRGQLAVDVARGG